MRNADEYFVIGLDGKVLAGPTSAHWAFKIADASNGTQFAIRKGARPTPNRRKTITEKLPIITK